VAGVGAAGVVVATAAPAAARTPAEEGLPAEASGPMAAYVRDVATGEVVLMIEGSEVVVTDKVLVARLARAYHRAERA
jgi:hypothetical protein